MAAQNTPMYPCMCCQIVPASSARGPACSEARAARHPAGAARHERAWYGATGGKNICPPSRGTNGVSGYGWQLAVSSQGMLLTRCRSYGEAWPGRCSSTANASAGLQSARLHGSCHCCRKQGVIILRMQIPARFRAHGPFFPPSPGLWPPARVPRGEGGGGLWPGASTGPVKKSRVQPGLGLNEWMLWIAVAIYLRCVHERFVNLQVAGDLCALLLELAASLQRLFLQ